MSESGEAEDGMILAVMEARRLRALNENHELLRLWSEADNDEVWEEFQTRFGKEGLSKEQRSCEPAQAYFWANYYIALRNACEEV